MKKALKEMDSFREDLRDQIKLLLKKHKHLNRAIIRGGVITARISSDGISVQEYIN